MRFSKLPSAFLALSITVAAPFAASASPASPAAQASVAPSSAPAASAADVVRYAAREAKDPALAEFRGGAEVLVIGGTTLALVLALVILVIVL